MIESMAQVEDRHWWFVARREILMAAATRKLGSPPTSILDLGCGTGGNLAALAQTFETATVVGLDSQPRCIELCRSRGLRVVSGDLTALPFADAEFELVTAFDVLEHVANEAAAASEIARVLAPRGTAIVTVPAYHWLWGPHDDLNSHKRRYTRPRLRATLAAAGLDVTYATYFNTILFPMAALVRIAEKITGKYAHEDRMPSAPVNWALYHAFRLERRLVTSGARLPYGTSVLAVAQHATHVAHD